MVLAAPPLEDSSCPRIAVKSHRFARNSVLLLAIVGVGVYGLGFYDWCYSGPRRPSVSTGAASVEGKLAAGASRVQLLPPYPVVIAGYGPPRPTAKRAVHPLYARALVVQVGALKVGLVLLDLLLVPRELVDDVRNAVEQLDLGHLWVVATHTHSSLGGYDPSILTQLAGTGRYHSANRAAIVAGAVEALRQAAASLAPATLETGEGLFPSLVYSRTEGLDPDGRLTRMLFK